MSPDAMSPVPTAKAWKAALNTAPSSDSASCQPSSPLPFDDILPWVLLIRIWLLFSGTYSFFFPEHLEITFGLINSVIKASSLKTQPISWRVIWLVGNKTQKWKGRDQADETGVTCWKPASKDSKAAKGDPCPHWDYVPRLLFSRGHHTSCVSSSLTAIRSLLPCCLLNKRSPTTLFKLTCYGPDAVAHVCNPSY